MNKVKLSLLALFCWVVGVGANAVERLPVSAFASLPEISTMSLSPDGKKIASLVNQEASTVLIVQDLEKNKAGILFKVDNNARSIKWFKWKNNDRLIISVRMASSRDSITTVESRLVSVRANGDDMRNLVKFNPDGLHQYHMAQFQDNVVDWLPGDPNHILVAIDIEEPLQPDVYKVDINDGSRDKVHYGREYVLDWITDRQHRVRVGIKTNYRFREDGSYQEIIVSNSEQTEWKTAWQFDALSENSVEPLGFGSDPNILYVNAYKNGYLGIFTVDVRDPQLKLVEREVAEGRDISGDLWYSEKKQEVVGLSNDYTGGYILWDDALLSLAGGIDKVMPDTQNSFVSFSEDETRYLLHATSNGAPGLYYLGDRKTKHLAPIGSTYSKLTADVLAGKRTMSYKARDGVEIKAYLTIPKGAEASKLPVIVFPHGGPISSESTDFDYWTEFFANRGYAVLQMDFRGSSGYGYNFMAAGFKQWGQHMQDDIVDGARWLIDSGIADKKRMCIVGASFGGYAALMGAVKNSDLFQCAVSFAGVTDLRDLLVHQRDYVNSEVAEKQIGDLWGDRVQLQANSPLQQVAKINIPLLLVHGTKDRRVPFQQTERLADALTAAGKPHQFIVLEDGDHWLSSYEHRIQLFEAMDEFLATHLGTGSTASASNTQATR